MKNLRLILACIIISAIGGLAIYFIGATMKFSTHALMGILSGIIILVILLLLIFTGNKKE